MATKRTSVGKQPVIDYGATRLTVTDHDKLLRHINGRLELSKRVRDTYISTFRYIDKEYHTWLLRDADDEKRQRDNRRGRGVKPVDEKLSMLFAQIDEAQTYLLSVLAPDEAIYNAIARKEDMAVAKAFAALMNQHAEAFHHFSAYALALIDTLKYNFGGFTVHWTERTGNMLVNSPTGAPIVKNGVVQDGNEICAIDPYNTLLDAAVMPYDVTHSGEYFATTELMSAFRLTKMEADGEIANLKSFLNTSSAFKYYENRDIVRDSTTAADSGTGVQDWTSILRGVSNNVYSPASDINVRELTTMHLWLRPRDWNLGSSTDFAVWRFVLGSDTHILSARALDNAHGLLPINIAMPWFDHFGWQSKGATERLIPHQRFASFTMNTHQRAVRKRLYGLTIYDNTVIPLLGADDVDMEGGKIPANTNGQDVDLRKKIMQFTDGPDTTNTLQNIDIMSSLMQDVLPTKMQQQVAGLDRATQYQAAATVQSANRRNLKLAKIINAQMMDSGRFMQMQNILQYQADIEIIDDAGNLIAVNMQEIRGSKVRFAISDGLKGLDKLALVMNIKEVLNSVLQSQTAAQQLDVVAIINYWTSLLGDNTDFEQFRIKSPIDTLPPEMKNQAFQLLQQALAAQEQTGTV